MQNERTLTLSPHAQRDLKGLREADEILAAITGYANGGKVDVKRRYVPYGWRMKIGDYRVFFQRENGGIMVLRVSHRRETYRTRRHA